MPLKRRTVSEAAALKALAHPLRMDLLESLVIDGPATATELAARIDDTPSNCSWHLRKLAEHGYVVEVAGATGRRRPWQAASEGLTWGSGDEAPEVAAAGRGLTDMLLARELQRLRDAQVRQSEEAPEWREATTLAQSALWLTAEEARELAGRLEELVLTHVERLRDPKLRPEGARLLSVVGWLAPRPDRPDATATTNDRANGAASDHEGDAR